MFTRFIILLVLVAPLVSALTINTPTGVTSGEMFNISWVTAAGDPTSWDFALFQALDLVTYLQDNVNSSLNVISLLCPFVPSSNGYIVEALDNSNAELALSATFFIAAANSSSGSSTAVSATTNTLTSTANSLPVTSSTSVSGGSSSSTGTGAAASTSTNPSSNSSPNSLTTIQREAIIGGVIGGLVLISILLALFLFNRRRRSQALREKSYTDPSPDVVNPFIAPSNPTSTVLPQNHTSNGQSLPSQAISSKFTQRGQPSDAANTSSSGPPLIPLPPQFTSPAFISPSSSRLPPTGSQTNPDGTEAEVPQAATEPSRQRSPSPRANTRYLRHEDSGVRIPPAENDVVESPPFYTP